MIELSESLGNKEEKNKEELIFRKNPEVEPEELLYPSKPRLNNFIRNKVFCLISILSISLFSVFLIFLFFFKISNNTQNDDKHIKSIHTTNDTTKNTTDLNDTSNNTTKNITDINHISNDTTKNITDINDTSNNTTNNITDINDISNDTINNITDYNNISILLCLKNIYKYIGMVSIASGLYNANEKTFLNYHIFLSDQEDKEIPKLIESMKYTINNRSKFYFYYINDTEVKSVFDFPRYREPAFYYRLKAPQLITNFDKVIYLDADTLILKDLLGMYNLNLSDNYMLGTLEVIAGTYFLGKHFDYDYINSGVLLMNLKKMREDKIYDKFEEYALNPEKRKNLVLEDQCLINCVCKGKIGILKPKYGSINIYNRDKIIHLSRQRSSLAYTRQEREEGFKNAFIVHFKMWQEITTPNYNDLWWNKYAKMTPVYEILKKNVSK